MPNPDESSSLQTLPSAFRKALFFFCWGRAIRALLTLFCDSALLLILCRAADPFCAEWNETSKRLLVWAALSGILFHCMWILFAPWAGKRGIAAFFTMLAHGSEKARKIAAPLLTRKMLADDTAAVIRVLTRGLEHFLPPASLSRAAASEGVRMILPSIVLLLLLLIPFGGDGGPEGKLRTFRSWLMGAKLANSLPLEIQSLFPGNTIIKPETEWIVKAVFNREAEDPNPFVRCDISGKRREIPLIAVSAREYQALMPPFSGECRYTLHVENRSSETFTILAQNSPPLIIRHISYQAGGAEKELFQGHRKWTLPSGARVTIAVEAPPNCIGLRIGGSGGLNTALEKNPGTGLWNAAFTVWESGAFFFRTLETDGTRGGSDLYTFEIQKDTPPAVAITAPENLEVLLHPAAVTVEAKDDSALGNVLLRLNNMNGGIETPGSAALTGTEREFKETFTLSVTKSARLLTSVIAIAAEAEENSPLRRNAFTDIHFHPIVLESESEMLNNPQVIRAFQEWRKKRKYQEANKQIPPPESPDNRNQQKENKPSPDAPEQTRDQKPNENPGAESDADKGGKQHSDGDQQEKSGSDRKKEDPQTEKDKSESGKQNAEQKQENGKKQNTEQHPKEKTESGKQDAENNQGSGGKQQSQDGQCSGGKQSQDGQCSGGKQQSQDGQGSGGKQSQNGQGSGGKQSPDGQGSGGKQSQNGQGSGGKQSQDGQGSGGKPGKQKNEQQGNQSSARGENTSKAGNEKQAQTAQGSSSASSGSFRSGSHSAPGGGGNTALNTDRNAKESGNPEETAPEVVVGTARRGDERKSEPQRETAIPPDRLPQNTEKDRPYSTGDDNRLHAESSEERREALILKDAGVEVIPGRAYTPEQKSELEKAIRRYDTIRARLNDTERRAADEYYRRLREILKQ